MIHEYVGNMHMHTPYSDGFLFHDEIALAAIRAGLDFVVTTDHNIYVGGLDGYRSVGERRVLLLVGEEVHDQTRDPRKNHMLIFEAQAELSPYAPSPQELIEQANEREALTFIAHPVDPEAPAFNEPDLSWTAWDVNGYAGIELWNFMSEFKSLLSSFPKALYYAFNPSRIAAGPFSAAISKWDSLLASGRRVVAIGGADAHAFPSNVGPIKRTLFPYEFHFQTVNTHILTERPLNGDVEIDRQRIFNAIRRGHCFVGYDLPARTEGFRFGAVGEDGPLMMGDQVRTRFGVTLQVKLPTAAQARLIRNGHEIKRWENCTTAVYTATDPGAYRIEAYLHYKGRLRGWIFSNPIYIID